MRNILLLILRFKNFLVYAFLSLISFVLMVNFNHLQRSNWLNSSGAVTGTVNNSTSTVGDYFSLYQKNINLAQDNALLQSKILKLTESNEEKSLKRTVLPDSLRLGALSNDTLFFLLKELQKEAVFYNDSTNKFIPAKVIKNATNSTTNFLSLDKGADDGIEIDDGVVTENGIVGRVVSTSARFALVKSVLHINNAISVELKKQKELGTIHWTGNTLNQVTLTDIPRHTNVVKGDSVFTSGYGTVYPRNHFVGIIKETELTENETFYNLEVDLSVNFNRLKHVYIYKNILAKELRALNAQTDSIP